ncbi:MAG: hypothetical protein JWQ76_1402 [Ramlibacter sp.]|nr:hypothetical protein [Ramlibacter sp.]
MASMEKSGTSTQDRLAVLIDADNAPASAVEVLDGRHCLQLAAN